MILAASISLARAVRSDAGRDEISAVRSVGAKRAIMRSSAGASVSFFCIAPPANEDGRNHKRHRKHIRISSFVLLVPLVVPSLTYSSNDRQNNNHQEYYEEEIRRDRVASMYDGAKGAQENVSLMGSHPVRNGFDVAPHRK